MIHSSWVWVAWVDRARSGSATLSDAMAAVTAPSARQTTAVTAVVLTRREAPGRNLVARKASNPATIAMITMTSYKRRKIRFASQGDHAAAGHVKSEYSFFMVAWSHATDHRRTPGSQAPA